MSDRNQVVNFGAGPSALPHSVLEEATQGLLNFNNTGIGITEISHRSKDFGAVLSKLESHIRTQLEVPPTHDIVFTQGGGSGAFSTVVLNMLARYRLLHPEKEAVLDYVVTGSWSKKGADEAKRLTLGYNTRVNVVADSRQTSENGKFDNIPLRDTYTFSEDPALIYYCENETVDGVQFAVDENSGATLQTSFPYDTILSKASSNNGSTLPPLVADYSSSFMSRRIPNLADHAVIFAGAQKNLGPSGLTIFIIRKDCVVDVDAAAKLGAIPIPIMLSFKTLVGSASLYNTPPTFAIYVAKLVLDRSERECGGLLGVEATNRKKAERVYAAVQEGATKGAFKLKVKEGSRSWMNVVFECKDTDSEKKFLEGGEAKGLKAMKGHR